MQFWKSSTWFLRKIRGRKFSKPLNFWKRPESKIRKKTSKWSLEHILKVWDDCSTIVGGYRFLSKGRFSGQVIKYRACNVITHRRWPLTSNNFGLENNFLWDRSIWKISVSFIRNDQKSIYEKFSWRPLCPLNIFV